MLFKTNTLGWIILLGLITSVFSAALHVAPFNKDAFIDDIVLIITQYIAISLNQQLFNLKKEGKI